MVHAVIMVKTEAGESEAVLERVLELEAVTEAHIVAGAWDIIAETDAAEMQGLVRASSSGIQQIRGVRDTKTYISMSA
ncbi:Lrp/AsnC ligand binding domain-containing protein [Halocalculus aciditolerans]|uniref:Transcription regulator-like protein n=1 Tax=Halocalculus aciditolerans TaxID=1383812 RepID=A0A830F854_9EURY|nr:Lrp/AsnC ligand binding domain-containing protein [Halocalculus aciditolerans]GGL49828.1 transcription regulator-like protein [Halocalculus aciditolerans]